MGSGRVDYFHNTDNQNGDGDKSSPLSYHEMCKNLCPDYMAMGMTAEEYWNGDPELTIYYRKANKLKAKDENYNMWLQGMYIYEALICASPLFRSLANHPKPIPYPDKPYALGEEERKERTKNQEEEKDLKNQAIIKSWVDRVNRIKAEKQAKGEKKDA